MLHGSCARRQRHCMNGTTWTGGQSNDRSSSSKPASIKLRAEAMSTTVTRGPASTEPRVDSGEERCRDAAAGVPLAQDPPYAVRRLAGPGHRRGRSGRRLIDTLLTRTLLVSSLVVIIRQRHGWLSVLTPWHRAAWARVRRAVHPRRSPASACAGIACLDAPSSLPANDNAGGRSAPPHALSSLLTDAQRLVTGVATCRRRSSWNACQPVITS